VPSIPFFFDFKPNQAKFLLFRAILGLVLAFLLYFGHLFSLKKQQPTVSKFSTI
jgi:hypothetical protein